MFDHPLLWLALATFIALLVILFWNLRSTRRQQKHGPNVSGMGGPNDPMA